MFQKTKIKNNDTKKMNIYKIMIVGDSIAGKTCFLLRYFGEGFHPTTPHTIGLDFKMKEIQLEEGQTIKLQIWDTAGQDRCYTMIKSYLKGTDGLIFIYDITSKYSFNFVRNWIIEYKGYLLEKVPIFLIGNKIDMEYDRQVSSEEGILLAKEYGCIFYECSAKSNINIDSIINGIVKKINDNYEQIVSQRKNKNK